MVILGESYVVQEIKLEFGHMARQVPCLSLSLISLALSYSLFTLDLSQKVRRDLLIHFLVDNL